MMDNRQSQGHQNGESEAEVHNASGKDVVPPGVNRRHNAALDGGWGWMCVLGCAISEVIFGFVVRTFGVTYLALLERYGESATATSWVGALNFSMIGFLGALASALCRRFGCRPVSMAGGAMAVIGVIATGQAPNIYVVYITYGLLTGIGLGFVFTPGYIIISQYFDKRKALALSMTSVAGGASALISPPLVLFLDREYGFSGMFLILGGVSLHLLVGASLYRPLNPQVNSSKLSSALGNAKKAYGTCCTPQKRLGVKDKQDDNADEDSPTTLPAACVEGTKQEDTMRERYSALLKNYAFVAFGLVTMWQSSATGIIVSLLPAMAVDNGVDETRAAFLLAISGISGLIGALALGHLFDVAVIRRFREHVFTGWFLVLGVGVLLMGVLRSYPAYITLCVLTGTANGVLMPQRITIIGDIVGKTSDMEGFGVVTFLTAFGGLVGRVIAGPIKDLSGSYNTGFLLCGSFTMTAALVFEAALIRHEMVQRRQQQTQTESVVGSNI